MKITRPKSKKKVIVILLTTVLIAGVSIVGFMYYFKTGPFAPTDSINMDPPTKEEKNTGTDIKKQSLDQDAKDSHTGSDPSPSPKPIEGSDKSRVNAEITSVNQNETHLRIRTLIQTITSSGTCNLTLTGPNQKAYTASAQIYALPSTSTCKGFDVPLNQLTPGTWTIDLEFNNDTLTASASKKVNVQ